ncbi:MAG TPA: NUDIX hydrolase [Geminicoccaceae bacterium]|nr:NUDIX hydrolase [Geminicoccaceae bacterium]
MVTRYLIKPAINAIEGFELQGQPVEQLTSRMEPTVGVMAVLLRDGKVLLVRRSKEPDAGRWSFPAGKIEMGETIEHAALRELAEETAVKAKAGQVLTAVDVIDYDLNDSVRHHFVIIAVPCAWISGEPIAGDDATDARWFSVSDVSHLDLARGFDVAGMVKAAMDILAM